MSVFPNIDDIVIVIDSCKKISTSADEFSRISYLCTYAIIANEY